MHRSGTSLLVGLLELHGFHLGDVSSQKSALKPTGTKESLEVRKINNQLLQNASSDWMNPKSLNSISQELSINIELAANYFNKYSRWAIKDPRMLFTYNHWINFLPSHQLIGTYRKPLEVAKSLMIKNGIEISDGLEIWRKYNVQLLKLWEKTPFPIIEFSAKKDQYLSQFEIITKHLGLDYNDKESNQFYQHTSGVLEKDCPVPKVYLNLEKELNQLTKTLS